MGPELDRIKFKVFGRQSRTLQSECLTAITWCMDVSRSDVVRLVLWGLKARLETVQFSITKLKAISKQLYLLSENLHKHAMPKELIELSGSLAQQAFLIATVGYEEHQTLQKVPRHD